MPKSASVVEVPVLAFGVKHDRIRAHVRKFLRQCTWIDCGSNALLGPVRQVHIEKDPGAIRHEPRRGNFLSSVHFTAPWVSPATRNRRAKMPKSRPGRSMTHAAAASSRQAMPRALMKLVTAT